MTKEQRLIKAIAITDAMLEHAKRVGDNSYIKSCAETLAHLKSKLKRMKNGN